MRAAKGPTHPNSQGGVGSMTALVLSGSYTETSRFASQHKLGYGVRHIVSAEGLAGRRPTSIHILPSYYDRRDIHATNAALKKLRRRVAHITPIEYDRIDGVWVVKGAVAESVQESETPAETPAPVPDESKDAVPGQIPIEEAIGETPPSTPIVVMYDAEPASPVAVPPLPPADADADDLPDWLK